MAHPIRTCKSCGSRRPKAELLRFAWTKDERLEVDPMGCLPGRGAYVCRRRPCVERFLTLKSVRHAFKRSASEQAILMCKEEIEGLATDVFEQPSQSLD